MTDLFAMLIIALVAGTVGVALGIFFLAPRITRFLDRNDEEPGAGDD
jgi:Sec-independent protein secretion pathway component TatC